MGGRMVMRARRAWKITCLALLGITLAPTAFGRNLVDEEKQIYIAQPLVTEPAWTQTGVYLKSFLFDLPNAVSRPNAQVGFVLTPGFTWSVLDMFELNVGFPMVLNPDQTGDRELDEFAAKKAMDGNIKPPDNWDENPDFDLPGLLIGLKGKLLGKKPEDRFFLAVGVSANLPIFETWATNFSQWKTSRFQTSPFIISPYVSIAYALGRFSPQLQLGADVRLNESVDPDTGNYIRNEAGNPEIETNTDFFFNLALPFAFAYEGTVPMLELNGVYSPGEGTQLFITPAVTFLPTGSAASLGFACMIPISDSAFRKSEGFRFVINFSYAFDALGIPAPEEENDGSSDISDEVPPAGW
jgi:hypothetical protein